MLRRVTLRVAGDLTDVERLVSASTQPVTLVVDADNTLVPQGASLEEFRRGVIAAIERFEAHPGVKRLVVLTNGPDRGVPGMIHRGNKPWTTRRRIGLPSRDGDVWIVGDQVLTDGVLAWRYGATFVHLVVDEENESSGQSLMRRLGRFVSPALFVTPDT